MSIEGYDVRDSPKLKRFCLERNLGDHTVRKYYVNLKRYVLSLSGHAHNYCNNKGCLDGYYCDTSNRFNYSCHIYLGEEITDCTLFGCIPGSYCNKDNTCIECDYQCRTCEQGNMKCISCYSNAIFPQWQYYRWQNYKTSQCVFEFYPLNKVESLDIPVPILDIHS